MKDRVVLACLIVVDGAGCELEALDRERRGVDRLELSAVLKLRIHLPLQVPVDALRLRRQVDFDDVLDRLLDVEVVLRPEAHRDVGDGVLNLCLRARLRAPDNGLRIRGHALQYEEPVVEGTEAAAEPIAAIDEPELPPKVLDAVRRRRAGELDEAFDVLGYDQTRVYVNGVRTRVYRRKPDLLDEVPF